MSNNNNFISYLSSEFDKYIKAERSYFEKQQFIERKERIIQVILIVFGIILAYNWTSNSMKSYLLYLFIAAFFFILLYYSTLPASIENTEFKYIANLCAKIIALLVSLAFILCFYTFFQSLPSSPSSNLLVTGMTLIDNFLVAGMMFIALFFLWLRLLYV